MVGQDPAHLPFRPARHHSRGGTPLPERDRTVLLGQVLTDQHAPLPSRAAAAILLLYAQPVSRITRLTIDDVSTTATRSCCASASRHRRCPRRSPHCCSTTSASAPTCAPIAMVITKFDAFFDVLGADHPLTYRPQPMPYYDEQAGRSTHEQVRALLHDWNADDIDAQLNYALQNVRYFVASALGAAPDYETGLISPGGLHPFRVDEPLLWLLSHSRAIPRSRARQ